MARTVIEVGEVLYNDAEIPENGGTRIPTGPNPHLSTVEFLAKNRTKAKNFILPVNPKDSGTASLDRTANQILGAHCRKLDEAGAVHGVTVKKDISKHLDEKGRQIGVKVVFWAVDKRKYEKKTKTETTDTAESKVPAQAGASE